MIKRVYIIMAAISFMNGVTSIVSTDFQKYTGQLAQAQEIINQFFDMITPKSDICTDCGTGCDPNNPPTRTLKGTLQVKDNAPCLENVSIVNVTSNATPNLSVGTSVILGAKDQIVATLTVQLTDCNQFSVFFDLDGASFAPTGIISTTVVSEFNPATTGRYGGFYNHVFESSTGNSADLAGILLQETVTCASDPFNDPFCNNPPTNGNFGPIEANGDLGNNPDAIGTVAGKIDVNNFKPFTSGKTVVFSTPQTFLYSCPGSSAAFFQPFVDIDITVTLQRAPTPSFFGVVTKDNGVSTTVQNYVGPPLQP